MHQAQGGAEEASSYIATSRVPWTYTPTQNCMVQDYCFMQFSYTRPAVSRLDSNLACILGTRSTDKGQS